MKHHLDIIENKKQKLFKNKKKIIENDQLGNTSKS